MTSELPENRIDPPSANLNRELILPLQKAEPQGLPMRAANQAALVPLVDSEARFQQIANTILDVFFLYDTGESRFLYVSPAYEEIWGRTTESLHTNPESWAESVHPDDRDSVINGYKKMLSSEKDKFEFRIRHPDGSVRWIEVRRFAILEHGGNIARIAGIAKNVTESKNSDLKFKNLLEAAPDAMVIVNREGEIVLVNLQTVNLFGWRREQLVGQKVEMLMPDLCRDIHQEHRCAFFGAPRSREMGAGLELFGLRSNGSNFPIEISLSPLETPDPELVMCAIRDISKRKDSERLVRDSENRFRTIFDQAPVAMVLFDMDGQPIISNQALSTMIGYSADELSNMQFSDFTYHEDVDKDMSQFTDLIDGKIASYSMEKRYVHKNGSLIWAILIVTIILDDSGNALNIFGMAKDITERKEAHRRIAFLNRVYCLLSDFNMLIVHVTDRKELFSEACRIAVEAGGFRMAMVITVDQDTGKLSPVASFGKNDELMSVIMDTLSSETRSKKTMTALAARENRTVVSNDSQNDPQVLFNKLYADSGVRSLAVFPLAISNKVVAVLGLYASEAEFFHDEEMTLLKQLTDNIGFAIDHISKKERLNYLAYYDALTGLPNRSLLHDRLDHAIAICDRYHDPIWVAFLNIDRFALVYSTLGHQSGDDLIKAIAARLQNAVRETDTLAHIGADEFVLVLPARTDEQLESSLLQRIVDAISKPFAVDGHELFLTCSVGVAIYPANGENAETLIKHADIAMHRATAAGSNKFQFYEHAMNEVALERLRMIGDLRHAIEHEEFVLHYQPQVDFCSGRIVGAEALIRWRHPELGLLTPLRFISLAEETGMIMAIGEWVIRTACRQNKTWQEAGLGKFRVAVNLSARQFAQPDLVQSIAAVLQETGLEACYLEIELTESMVMTDFEQAIEILTQLKSLGLQISIDDFGTGYSSLAYLKRFPIDALKIDRSFVRDIAVDTGDAAIAKAIVAMAHAIGIRVIAEGVETEQQCDFLRQQMCDELQGFFFSRPLAPPEIDAVLREGRCLPAHLLRWKKPARTLLIVDDEVNIVAALKRLLRPDNYRILTANSGQEGLDLLAENANGVDVIISDQRMPGMTGVEFLRKAKQLHPDTVRIVLSGYTELQSVTDAVNEGAIYKFFTKPWDDEKLRKHIAEAFRHKQLADENQRLNLEIQTANQELAASNRKMSALLDLSPLPVQRDCSDSDTNREIA